MRQLSLILCIIAFASAPAAAASRQCADLFYSFHSLIPEKVSKQREHPDLVDAEKLEKGDTFFVEPITFRDFPQIEKRLSAPVEMTVVAVKKISTSQAAGHGWQNQSLLIYANNPITGTVALSGESMKGYDNPYFLLRGPFELDEYVQVGKDEGDSLRLTVLNGTGSTVLFEGDSIPFIGILRGVLENGNYVVEINSTGDGIKRMPVEVPKDALLGLGGGTKDFVQRRLHPLVSQGFHFVEGEAVRFRDSMGLMQPGVYVGLRGENHEIETKSRRGVLVSDDSIFKMVGPANPRSPVYKAEWIRTPLEKPRGLLAQALNAAAKLESRQEFIDAANDAKLRFLIKYTNALLPASKAGFYPENAGLTTFNKLLCAGVGICRHQAPFLATILAEAGYSVHLMILQPSHGTAADGSFLRAEGHTWLEVDMPLRSGGTETFVVDALNADFPIPYWKIYPLAKKYPDSPAAKYYAHPGRTAIYGTNW